MRTVDVTPLIRPRISPAWFTARVEENLIGALAVSAIVAATALVLVTA